MAATDDSKAYVKSLYDECVKLDDSMAKARAAFNQKIGLFRSFQRAGETTAEMDERFPRRIRRSKEEIAAEDNGDK